MLASVDPRESASWAGLGFGDFCSTVRATLCEAPPSMSTIANPRIVSELIGQLRQLQPDTPRRWGTLSAGEMLCHLGDAHESVLQTRIPPGSVPPGAPRRVMKWVALYSPSPWPKGIATRPGVNPKINGTRPGDFELDRARAIESLESLVTADSTTLLPQHVMFGPMSTVDWHRWAYRHVRHHLRQFGL